MKGWDLSVAHKTQSFFGYGMIYQESLNDNENNDRGANDSKDAGKFILEA